MQMTHITPAPKEVFLNKDIVEECLKTFSILVDTREHNTARSVQRFERFKVPYRRQKLEYGDYTYNFTFPDGQELYSEGDVVAPKVYIERKMDLDELSGCFTHSRERFRAEFQRAKDSGAKGYLVVENSCIDGIYAGRYRTLFKPMAYQASFWAFVARFDLSPVFVSEDNAGRVIRDILFRELKQKLVTGVYG